MTDCNCTNPTPFPTSPTFSITRYVEMFVINRMCDNGPRNQIDMFAYEENYPVRKLLYRMNFKPGDYLPYIMVEIVNKTIKTKSIEFTDYVIRNSTYIMVNKELPCVTPDKIYDAYHLHFGYNKIGSVQFPEEEIRPRLVMPSRDFTFR